MMVHAGSWHWREGRKWTGRRMQQLSGGLRGSIEG